MFVAKPPMSRGRHGPRIGRGKPKGVLPKSEDYDKTRALGPNQGPGAAATAAAVDADALKPGTLAGAYVLKKELASGGGGTVYEAHHRILGRRAAVKVPVSYTHLTLPTILRV